MTKRKAGPISDAEEARIQAAIARDPDAPEVTDEQAQHALPASDALDPALFANLTRRGRPKSESSKKLVTLRLPPEVIAGYQEGGPGWQVRMGDVLAAGLKPRQRSAGTTAHTKIWSKGAKTTIVQRDGNTGRYAVARAGGAKPKNKPKSA